MADFLEQAKIAAQGQNWSLMRQYLEQLLDMPPEIQPARSDQAEISSTETSSAEASSAETSSAKASDHDRALALALQILEQGDFQAQWDAAKLFPIFGEAAIAPLIALLEDTTAEFETRWFAARLLGEFNRPETIQTLMTALQNADDEDLSAIAAEALANLGTSAIDALADLLTQPASRLLSIQSLAKIRRSETIAPLLTAIDDPQPEIRATVIEALGSFHDARIPPVLVNALCDPVALVRQRAIAALSVRRDLLAAFDLVNLFNDRLQDFNLNVCQQAANALGRLGTEAAAAALFQAFVSPNTLEILQREIVRSLGWTETPTTLDYLQQALHQPGCPDPVAQEIITTLGRWTEPTLQPQAAKILLAALEPQLSPGLKQAIALALGQLRQPQALAPLIQLLADQDTGVRLHTIAALKLLNAELAYAQLQALSQQPLAAPLQHGVAIALAEWSAESAESVP